MRTTVKSEKGYPSGRVYRQTGLVEREGFEKSTGPGKLKNGSHPPSSQGPPLMEARRLRLPRDAPNASLPGFYSSSLYLNGPFSKIGGNI